MDQFTDIERIANALERIANVLESKHRVASEAKIYSDDDAPMPAALDDFYDHGQLSTVVLNALLRGYDEQMQRLCPTLGSFRELLKTHPSPEQYFDGIGPKHIARIKYALLD